MSKIFIDTGDGIYCTSPVNPVEVTPGVYNLLINKSNGKLYLSHVGDKFNLPFKIYDIDLPFIKRVVISFKNTNKNLGVLLNGLKGAGKTITAKIIANELNLPVILISDPYDNIPEFINNINFECVIFIDEYEKVFNDDKRGLLLSCMDGAQSPKKKVLYLLTTNTLHINENLLNRPSRIRYIKTYEDLSKKQIMEVVEDLLVNKQHEEDAVEEISKLDSITIDLIIELIKEANLHEEPISKFTNVFNCNRGTSSSKSYRLTDKVTGQVLYDNVKLKGLLSPYAQKNVWIYLYDGTYFCMILQTTGENSLLLKITNPEYAKWEEGDMKEPCPQEYIEKDCYYEILGSKHYVFGY